MSRTRTVTSQVSPPDHPDNMIFAADWEARSKGLPPIVTAKDISDTLAMVKDGLFALSVSDTCYLAGHPNLPPVWALWLISNLLESVDKPYRNKITFPAAFNDAHAWDSLRAIASSPNINPVVAGALVYADYSGGTYGDLIANPAVSDDVIDVVFAASKDIDLHVLAEVIGRFIHRPNLSDRHINFIVDEMTSPVPFGLPVEDWYSDSSWHPLILTYQQALAVIVSDDWVHSDRITEEQHSRLLVTLASR